MKELKIVYKGDWSSGEVYMGGDAVTHNETVYVATNYVRAGYVPDWDPHTIGSWTTIDKLGVSSTPHCSTCTCS